ncbi:MAG TPA: hypothetical protein VGH19_09250 [Verrucomicrobiae bacterium]
MSQEPEKDIEKQLREHAEKRRAAAGDQVELHPATRAMLQGEVARTYGTTSAAAAATAHEKSARPWWSYWPGLLFASCCVMLLAVFTMKPGSQNEMDFAQAPGTPPAATAISAEMAPTSPQPAAFALDAGAPPSPREAMESVVFDPQGPTLKKEMPFTYAETKSSARQAGTAPKDAVMSVFEPAKLKADALAATPAVTRPLPANTASAPLVVTVAAPASAPISSASITMREDLTEKPAPTIAAKRMAVTALPPPAPSAPSASVPAPDVAQAAEKAKVALPSDNTGQRFEQIPSRAGMRRNLQSPPSPEVLEQFQVQQNGNELKITDNDGSVYLGSLITPEEANRNQEARDEVAKDNARIQMNRGGALRDTRTASEAENLRTRSALAESNANIDRYFRATGMNRTLNQPVVIDGTFKNTAAIGTNANTRALVAKKQIEAPTNLPPSMQIQGRAVIGDRQELIINAIPVNR